MRQLVSVFFLIIILWNDQKVRKEKGVAAPPFVYGNKRPHKAKPGISKQISVFVKYGNYLLINLLYLASKYKDYVIGKKYYSS